MSSSVKNSKVSSSSLASFLFSSLSSSLSDSFEFPSLLSSVGFISSCTSSVTFPTDCAFGSVESVGGNFFLSPSSLPVCILSVGTSTLDGSSFLSSSSLIDSSSFTTGGSFVKSKVPSGFLKCSTKLGTSFSSFSSSSSFNLSSTFVTMSGLLYLPYFSLYAFSIFSLFASNSFILFSDSTFFSSYLLVSPSRLSTICSSTLIATATVKQ